MKTNRLTITIILFFISFNGLYAQVMLREITLKEQIDRSALVVEGEVISKTSFWSNNLIYTSNTVQVYKVFKGTPVSTIEVITLGGTVELTALVVSTGLKLYKGNVGVFMLQKSDVNNAATNKILVNQFQPFGAIQGFYKYDVYSDVAVNPFNKKQGISLNFYKEIISATGNNYVEVSSFNTVELNRSLNQKSALAPIISNFNPTTATAGTKTRLTINGTGFGTTMGKVSFADADEGGKGSYTDALETQIVSWGNTQIVVEIPSGAGTGKIRVTDAASAMGTSSGNLTISYSEINVVYDPDDKPNDVPPTNGPLKPYAYPVQHYGQTSGGYEWEMQTQFFNDSEYSGARAAFERAFETWRCTTKINWTIKNVPTVIDVVASDDTNVIRFDNVNELDSGVLGTCYSWYNGCGSYPNLSWFVSELDIVFDAGGTTDWNFGPGPTTVLGEYDFETVALHELGHGHQLGHVIDTDAVMHYALSFNEDQRALNSDDIAGATDIQDRSTSTSVCVKPPMTDYSGPCSLSVEDDIFKLAVKIYPNPSNGTFYIKNDLNLNLQKATVYDMSGRLISEINLSGASETSTINLTGMAKGMYLVNIHSDHAFVTKKIILE
ncbi:T9SS type A sorting domain-containing protein [Gaetbulibacter aquiaggeris]|uniref:T9SS type A sorting domain-containing protein n=1 Tax=Gaetbulibacter aquiaggeris TaxID=1735373 RepID=A0ABW7MLC4_9FLAO